MLQGTEMDPARMQSFQMTLMWFISTQAVPCWSLIEEMLLFGKSLSTRRIVIINLIQLL
uniref:Uncharacterized protein n=1 Tax=Rhizophora mucronata TaxID=61149 RepID=A0A2P2K7T7_RHIMU